MELPELVARCFAITNIAERKSLIARWLSHRLGVEVESVEWSRSAPKAETLVLPFPPVGHVSLRTASVVDPDEALAAVAPLVPLLSMLDASAAQAEVFWSMAFSASTPSPASVSSLTSATLSTSLLNSVSLNLRKEPPEQLSVILLECLTLDSPLRLLQLDRHQLASFILQVSTLYRREPAYHNWLHATSVCHFAFALLHSLNWSAFTALDRTALLLATLCHDIDHAGLNNSYLVSTSSSMARAYGDVTPLEKHHFEVTRRLLEGSGLLSALHLDEKAELLGTIEYIILITDLPSHLREHSRLENLPRSALENTELGNRRLLLGLLMTLSDLCDQAKPWPNSWVAGNVLYKEFHAQGSLELRRSTCVSQPNMDAESSVPDRQLQFITDIVRPAFACLKRLAPENEAACECTANIEDNLRIWRRVNDLAGDEVKLHQIGPVIERHHSELRPQPSNQSSPSKMARTTI